MESQVKRAVPSPIFREPGLRHGLVYSHGSDTKKTQKWYIVLLAGLPQHWQAFFFKTDTLSGQGGLCRRGQHLQTTMCAQWGFTVRKQGRDYGFTSLSLVPGTLHGGLNKTKIQLYYNNKQELCICNIWETATSYEYY